MNNLVMLRSASFVNLTFQHARFCHVRSFLYKEHEQRGKRKRLNVKKKKKIK